MATIFPTSPAPQVNDEYQGYRYNGTSWEIIGIDLFADYQTRITGLSNTELGYLDGVTSSVQTQLNAKAPLASPTFTGTVTIPAGASISGYLTTSSASSTYAPLSGATFTGDIAVNGGDITTSATSATLYNTNATTLNIGGAATTISIGDTAHSGTTTINHNLAVYGNITFGNGASQLSSTTIQVDDTLISLADNNTANILDIGFYAGYQPSSTALHTGLVKDASDSGIWKLFSGISAQPTGTVDFTGATFDTLKIGALQVTDASTTRTNLGLGTMATATATDYLTTSTASSTYLTQSTASSTYAPLASPTFTGTVTATTFSGSLSGNASTATSATTAGSTTVFGGTMNADTSMGSAVILWGGSSSGSQATTTQRTVFGGDAGYLWACRNSASANLVLQKGGSNVGSVLQTVYNTTSLGNISISTTATSFNTTSDYRLKENITSIDDPIALIKRLKPSTWDWKNEPSALPGNGFIAHELQEVIPAAVTGEKDALDEEGNPKYQAVDASFIVPFLTAATQKLIEKIETLEAEIEELKNLGLNTNN